MKTTFRTGLLLAAILAAGAAPAQDGTNYAELKRISEAAKAKSFAEKAAATLVVLRSGRPVRKVDPRTGQIVEVMRLSPNGRPIYFTTFNANAAKSTRANKVYAGGGAGLSLTGSGVKLGIWDGGTPLTTHQDLTGRVTLFDTEDLGTHATHVSATLIGAGVNALAKGMASQATLDAYDWDEDTSEAAAAAAAGSPISISNHSYGPIGGWAFDTDNGDWYWMGDIADSIVQDSQFGMYDDYCSQWDNITYNAPFYLPVWAVGNDRGQGPTSQPIGHFYYDGDEELFTDTVTRNLDGNGIGYDTICGMAAAKNVLSVGAVDDVITYANPASVVMSTFSGWGPTDDGRIKPDVVGNGVEVLSAVDSANNAYATDNGTSMATPNVGGSTALLVQHYRNTHAGANMRSATMRGLVIHTADECGAATGPDYKFGWGLMDTEAAAKVISDDGSNPDVIRESALPNGGTHTYRVTSNGTTPLRFTLCWTDPTGVVQTGLNNRTPRLKHDLDMRVTFGATTYSPYKLDYAAPANPATTGDNNVDNVEVINIAAPTAGTYLITIDHDGTLASTQNYSLIVTGAPYWPLMSAFTINGTWITGGNSTNGTVTINQPAPAGGFMVYPRVSPAGAFNINSPVVIPQGQTSKTFPIVGTGNVNVNTPYSVFMDAGYKSLGVSGTLVPMRLNLMTVTPNPVQANHDVTMTVGINGPAPAGGLVLDITRSPTFWIMAPATVTIPAGQKQVTIQIPIRAGAPAISNARLTVIQNILPSGTVSLSRLFDITL
jgi:hypothetical protein